MKDIVSCASAYREKKCTMFFFFSISGISATAKTIIVMCKWEKIHF